MSSYIKRNLKQTATYWSPGTNDGFGGVSWGAPVEVKCRWEEKVQQFIDFSGNETVSNAIVYVDTDVETMGYLFEGTSASTDPTTLSAAKQIRLYNKTPSLKANIFERKVYL